MEKTRKWKARVIRFCFALVVYGILSFALPDDGAIAAEAAGKQVMLSKQSMTVRIGTGCRLQMKNLSKGTRVKWTISKKSVAGLTISNDTSSVLIWGKKSGSATVTASIDGEIYSCQITVKPAVSLSSAKESIVKGKSFTLTLDGASKAAKWSVTDGKILKIKKTGKNQYKVTGLKKGSAYVVAVVNGKQYKCKVTVKNPPVALSKKSLTVNYGTSKTITLQNTSRKVTWRVKNTSIAGIDAADQNCTIIPKMVGTTYVYAVSQGKTYTCKVTVRSVSKVKFVKSGYSISLDSPNLQVSVKNNSYPVVKWGIENKKIAAISSNGVVTAKKAGKTRIYAVVDGKKICACLTVNNSTNPVMEVTVQTEPGNMQEADSSVSSQDTIASDNISNEEKCEIQGSTDKNSLYEYDLATFYTTVVRESGSINVISLTVYTDDPACYLSVDDPDQIITYRIGKGTADIASNSGTTQEVSYVKCTLTGRKKGTCTITAYKGTGELLKTSAITITSTDTEYYEYTAWKEKVKAKIWTDQMSDFEKIVAVGQYILDYYDYVGDVYDYYCFFRGTGGNCTASASLICDFAEDLGLDTEEINDIPGMSTLHERARVWFRDGSVYDFDASYVATAGNRGNVWYIQR